MEKKFYKEALFGGMTSNAFKLGTVLTGGWFWVRNRCCMMLYCGDDISAMDFENILAVFERDGEQINVPNWLEHKATGRNIYAVRRANCCGNEEKGLKGIVIVEFDDEGNLAGLKPNSVFGLTIRRIAPDEVELVWFYCPLGQGSEPVCFKIYSDRGSGQIDYENHIGLAVYKGKGFYSYTVEQLNDGRHIFAVRAENRAGAVDGTSAAKVIEVDFTLPQQGQIISVEAM